MARRRRCKASGKMCSRALPTNIRSMRIHTNVSVCSVECAQAYAATIGHVLSGEHFVCENGVRDVEYYTKEPEKRGEAKE